tara:strand:+ start:131 stop:313 length:183 start_codon:yes stop_codon:yes gene_type:complete
MMSESECTVKSLRAALRKHAPPYLGELKKGEMKAWMRRHLTPEQRADVYREARERAGGSR